MLTNCALSVDIFGAIGAFFDAIMQPLYWAISGLMIGWHALFSTFMNPNSGVTWVLAIAGLIVVVRSAIVPLFIKQMRSTRNLSTIQPKLQELQKRYGSDRERLGQETMKLYREEGVNPMASCFPLLVQMPVMIALFTVMNSAARGQALGLFKSKPELLDSLRNAEFFGAKLSATFLPFENGQFGPTQIFTAVMVLGMVGTMFYTQWQMMHRNMTAEALNGPMARQQRTMMYLFPLSYLFFGLTIPSGVLVYWFFSNIWTLVQQELFIRNAPALNTPAYLDWEERMRKKGLDPRQIERDREAKRRAKLGRSLPENQSSTQVIRQDVSGKPTRQVVRQAVDVDNPDETKKVVIRQQPRKQSRAVRKKQ